MFQITERYFGFPAPQCTCTYVQDFYYYFIFCIIITHNFIISCNIACECNADGSENLNCDENGNCTCDSLHVGLKCDTCDSQYPGCKGKFW